MKQKIFSKLLKLLFGFVGVYLAFCLVLYLFQTKLLFHPNSQSFQNCPRLTELGVEGKRGVGANGVRFRHYEWNRPGAKAWLVIFHGNKGSSCERAYLLESLRELPISFSIFEYPGFSTGDLEDQGQTPNEAEILQSADEYFQTTFKERELKIPIIIFGESLGTGVSAYIASKHPDSQIRGLILQAPYTSIEAIAQERFYFYLGKWALRSHFHADTWAPQVKIPVFAFHNFYDSTIPYMLGFEQAHLFSGLLEFRTFKDPKIGHNGFRHVLTSEYWNMLTDFIQRILR